jgi:uncharacterized protein YyaL (SSP411 family)
MRFLHNPIRPALLALACVLPLASPSCRKVRPPVVRVTAPAAEVAPELGRNALGESFSPMLRAQAASPIHWQPWSQETFQRAEKANRLIFAVIAQPQQSDYRKILSAMDANPEIVREVNSSYVPVLIDGSVYREMALLAPVFCGDTRQPLRLPLLTWFTPAGHLVTTVSSNPDANHLSLVFDQAHGTVSQMWETSRDYVLQNSAHDHEGRLTRVTAAAKTPPAVANAAVDTLTTIRNLTALYDPLSRTFDNVGGLFPSSSLELFASVALAPQAGEGLRQRANDTSSGLSHDLSTSAMIDPLDGGVFVGRRSATWELPIFSRDCTTQARAAIALFQASRAPGNPVLLEQARAALQFAEKAYGTPDHLFSSGYDAPFPAEQWLWKTDDLEKALSASQARLWTYLSDWRPMGNIAIDNDPKRLYLHLNRLALNSSLDQAAEKLGISPEDARREFEAARQTLLSIRNQRFGNTTPDRTPQAAASFRMVSAYSAAFAATGEPAFRQQAIDTFASAREQFARGTDLRPYAAAVPPGEGRAFLYALAMQAALDLADVTLDNRHAEWAEQLAATVSERFVQDTALLEAPKEQNLSGLPISDRIMLFEESTAGLLSACEARLTRRAVAVPSPLNEALGLLPADVQRAPVAHTDLLFAALLRNHGVTVSVGIDAPADLKDAIACLPLRLFTRATATPDNPAPPTSARVRFADGAESVVATSKELLSAIQAGGPKP